MSAKKRSPQKLGIAERTDKSGREQYRGTAYDQKAKRHLRGPWTYNLAEARSWRVDALARIQSGELSAERGLTVSEAVDQFVAGIDSGAVRNRSGHEFKPSVKRDYRRDLYGRIVPLIGPSRLRDLTLPDMQRVVDNIAGQGLAASTVRNAIMAFRSLVAWARRSGYMRADPCDGLRLPSGERKRERIATRDEAALLVASLAPRDRAALGLACYGGLRAGELLGLAWQHIDLERGVIHVERAWDASGQFVAPKSKAARRVVPIAQRLHVLLLDHIDVTGGDGLLFPGKGTGKPMSYSGLVKRMKARWETVGLEPLGLHEARHTFASILIAAGANAKAISTFMGHGSISITFDRYGHLMPGSEAEVRGLMDAYLSGD
jgi:integrase